MRAYLAAYLGSNPDLPNIKRAIRLEPFNAQYRELLGRNLALSGASLDEAISNYRTAVRLNPYESRYWLDLAGAYQVAGRIEGQAHRGEKSGGTGPPPPQSACGVTRFLFASRTI